MKVSKSLWLVVVSLLAAVAQAQMDGMGMMQRMRSSPVLLTNMPDIRKELKLNGDQNKQIDAIQKAYQKKLQDMQKDARAQGGSAMMGMAKAMQDEMDKSSQAILAVFTPEQTKRFTEIQLQVMGPVGLSEPDLQKALALSSDQVSKIETITSDAMNKTMALVQPGQRNANGRNLQKQVKAIDAERDAAILQVLTADQAAKYKELLGPPSAAAKKMADMGF